MWQGYLFTLLHCTGTGIPLVQYAAWSPITIGCRSETVVAVVEVMHFIGRKGMGLGQVNQIRPLTSCQLHTGN